MPVKIYHDTETQRMRVKRQQNDGEEALAVKGLVASLKPVSIRLYAHLLPWILTKEYSTRPKFERKICSS